MQGWTVEEIYLQLLFPELIQGVVFLKLMRFKLYRYPDDSKNCLNRPTFNYNEYSIMRDINLFTFQE